MDMLSIKTKFMRKLISGVITKMLSKQIGKEVKVDLSELEFGHGDDSELVTLKISGNVTITTETLKQLIEGAI